VVQSSGHPFFLQLGHHNLPLDNSKVDDDEPTYPLYQIYPLYSIPYCKRMVMKMNWYKKQKSRRSDSFYCSKQGTLFARPVPLQLRLFSVDDGFVDSVPTSCGNAPIVGGILVHIDSDLSSFYFFIGIDTHSFEYFLCLTS
jgi:hypothetical protein